jgi:REP element-mobilizing transposase RayT
MRTRPHSKDLRKGRFSQPNGVYLLTWATYQRKPWFSDWTLGRLVVNSLRRAQALHAVESLAFVVMPDHVHWLVSLGNLLLEELMRNVKGHSGFHVKQYLRQQSGAVPKEIWQEGYHDHALRSDECVQDAARYIVLNPVRGGLVKSVREYPLWDAKWL